MNREELEKELDEWLDRTVSGYGRADTGPGFESRLIGQLNSRLEKRRFHFHWIPVAATVAALVVSLFLFRNSYQDRAAIENATNKPVEVESGPNPIVSEEAAGNIAIPAEKKRGKRPHSKQPSVRFLSSGLSDQERSLIAFARVASQQANGIISEDTGFEPLQFPKTNIPDFTIPEFRISPFALESLPTPKS